MEKRIVNINFKCRGLIFDAAVDCNNALKKTLDKEYLPEEVSEYRTNIELYCMDMPKWGVRFIHYEGDEGVVVNDKSADFYGMYHTVCDMDEILKAASEWIDDEFEKEDAQFADKPWFNACCKECKYRRKILRNQAGHCHILYVQKNSETHCGLVQKWLETRIKKD